MLVSTAIDYSKAFVRRLILPRPGGGRARHDEPLVVAGMFRTGNGIGRAAQRCVEALLKEHADPVAVDLSAAFGQADLPHPTVALQQFPQSRSGTLVLFANPPEVERALMVLGLRRWHDWHIIGAWVWELPAAPKAWRLQEGLVSEIWAPSRFVADAFQAQFGKPVRVVPHHVPVKGPLPVRSDGPIQVLAIADARSSLERKNLMGAIKMFRAAFPENFPAKLTVKCRNLFLFPDLAAALDAARGGDPRIRLLDQNVSASAQAALLETADILLSPHRSEGFGLNLAEAMALGKCVIATGWSGNVDFMPKGSASLLPYKLVPAIDPSGIYALDPSATWAEPDFDAGVAALTTLAVDPVERARIGGRARIAIAERLEARKTLNALAHLSRAGGR